MKSKGFTLIELMIVIAIIGIVAAIFAPALSGKKADTSYTTRNYGNAQPYVVQPPQPASTKCIGGFLFSIDASGEAKPATDAQGRAVKCD